MTPPETPAADADTVPPTAPPGSRGAPPPASRSNRGPAAAAANRESILDSAHRLFSTQGLNVPLSTIARDAGVGQGVLYRHFPTRLDLALAVFEDNFRQIERAVTAEQEPSRQFLAAWSVLVDLTVSDIAFVELAVADTRDRRAEAAVRELTDMIGPLLLVAQDAGAVDARVGVDTLVMALRAAYGLVVTRPAGDPSVRGEVNVLLRALGLPATGPT